MQCSAILMSGMIWAGETWLQRVKFIQYEARNKVKREHLHRSPFSLSTFHAGLWDAAYVFSDQSPLVWLNHTSDIHPSVKNNSGVQSQNHCKLTFCIVLTERNSPFKRGHANSYQADSLTKLGFLGIVEKQQTGIEQEAWQHGEGQIAHNGDAQYYIYCKIYIWYWGLACIIPLFYPSLTSATITPCTWGL